MNRPTFTAVVRDGSVHSCVLDALGKLGMVGGGWEDRAVLRRDPVDMLGDAELVLEVVRTEVAARFPELKVQSQIDIDHSRALLEHALRFVLDRLRCIAPEDTQSRRQVLGLERIVEMVLAVENTSRFAPPTDAEPDHSIPHTHTAAPGWHPPVCADCGEFI